MFNQDFIIDSVQNAKKTFVNTFVTDKKFQTELIKLVDAQTTFAKGQVNASMDIAQAFIKNASDAFYASIKKAA